MATSIATSSRARVRAGRRRRPSPPSGVTVMGGPQLLSAIAVSKAIRARTPDAADRLGRGLSDRLPGSGPECALCRLRRQGPGRGDLRRTCWSALRRRRRDLVLASIAGLTWRKRRRDRAQRGAQVLRREPHAHAALRQAAKPAAIPHEHLSGPAHHRLSGRLGVPLPLHVLRRRDHVPRQDGAAAGGAARAGSRSS